LGGYITHRGGKTLEAQDPSGNLCAFVGGLGQFAGVASYAWYSVVATNAILVLRAPVEKPPFLQPERRDLILTVEAVVVWSVATLSVLVPAFQGALGPVDQQDDVLLFEDYHCWVMGTVEPEYGWGINFSVFVWSCLTALVLLVVVISTQRLERRAQMRVLSRTVVFVGLFLVVWVLQHVRDFTEWWCRQHPTATCDPPDVIVEIDVSIRGAAGILTFMIWWPSQQFRSSAGPTEEEARVSGVGPGPGVGTEAGVRDAEDGRGAARTCVELRQVADQVRECCGCSGWCWNAHHEGDLEAGGSSHTDNALHKGLLSDHSAHPCSAAAESSVIKEKERQEAGFCDVPLDNT